MKKIERALFVGRFQPFHLGHYKVIKSLLKKFNEIIIVVGSSNEKRTVNNPYSAGERIELIRKAFTKTDLARIIIVPVPDVNNHAIWPRLVFEQTPAFEIVFSNNDLVRRLFDEMGIKTSKIKFINRKQYEGQRIRTMMENKNEKWKKLVPKQLVSFLGKLNATITELE